MATESELRNEFHAASDAPTRGIDTAAVLTRARARRTPRLVAFSSLAVLAVAGVTTLGITSLPGLLPSRGGAQTAADAPSYSEPDPGTVKGEDSGGRVGLGGGLEQLNRCAQPVTVPTAVSGGLSLSVEFPTTASADGSVVTGTVRMTNTGSTRITGSTASSPFMTLSRDGIVSWHSNGPMDSRGVLIDLAPGASVDYTAEVRLVVCSAQDETGDGFREALPPLGPGAAAISAAIVFLPDAPGAGGTLVMSRLVPVDLR
ncbi:hypothetical protein BKA04_000671 [Cryobacterium mesophilum]|uniref:Uncharacterized protein n=1 Tax=Terrimesophilobacter mesophilus TaxID=433647 RepID=A0A4V3IA61_9MICO|nr:hypothetical protein [Terrimesophilobacter mesophilus]MBB5632448.1 hypothetical protein [Terrimesophilobacter mesophilus]TFB79278.1 hypothetical protein E3N84_03945 [Terrimesophilobacter mesophilus]